METSMKEKKKKKKKKKSFHNELENPQLIRCAVFLFPSYTLKMLLFKHFMASFYKALSLLVVKYLEAKILH